MMIKVIAGCLALFLTGCQTFNQLEQKEKTEFLLNSLQTCEQIGYQEHTPELANCLERAIAQHTTEAQQTRRTVALVVLGGILVAAAASGGGGGGGYQKPQKVRLQTDCTSNRILNTVYTNCN